VGEGEEEKMSDGGGGKEGRGVGAALGELFVGGVGGGGGGRGEGFLHSRELMGSFRDMVKTRPSTLPVLLWSLFPLSSS